MVTATPQPLFPQERDPVHIARKASPPSGSDPWTVRPVANRYTTLATYAHPPTFLVPLKRAGKHVIQVKPKIKEPVRITVIIHCKHSFFNGLSCKACLDSLRPINRTIFDL